MNLISAYIAARYTVFMVAQVLIIEINQKTSENDDKHSGM